MKKKFLILTLCFTLVFTSINYKKTYADGGILSLPILATVSALAVGTGISLNNSDDIYDIGYGFYEYVKNKNDLMWDTVVATFQTSVSVLSNGLVSVDSPFLDLVKGYFDSTFDNSLSTDGNIYLDGVPVTPNYKIIQWSPDSSYSIGGLEFVHVKSSVNKYAYVDVYDGGVKVSQSQIGIASNNPTYELTCDPSVDVLYIARSPISIKNTNLYDISSSISIPYYGTYDWDNNVEDKRDEDGSISLPVPGNLGDLVGSLSPGDVWNPSYDLVGDGSISIPNVDSPSIGVTDDTFVGAPSDTPTDTPTDTPFANITEYIISLVVPSDSYWTDTFGGLYNNFTSSFPLVDMDNFNDLVTGEKKFPNIDINIMGVNGRVVNGDVINSIVDWLRPIVAGFMMLCLMLFNYRKIYKTIRGVEPFQGIAQGTSDFRTGISSLSKADYEANEMELAKALHDYYEDTGKTYKVRI